MASTVSISPAQVSRTMTACKPLFFALGETARQQILLLLSENESLNVNQLTERLPLSRPAISHHLKILRDAGMVDSHPVGVENRYFLTWDDAVAQLEVFVGQIKRCAR